ncbi:hypothetical protein AB1Y20_019282 [Prymnesium parvum]|uniref:Methyltransferase domain-containing protein n=1 Tax=Prymnesium parvum TaxID=97485 RepID=A0AB34JU75_PRYPA
MHVLRLLAVCQCCALGTAFTPAGALPKRLPRAPCVTLRTATHGAECHTPLVGGTHRVSMLAPVVPAPARLAAIAAAVAAICAWLFQKLNTPSRVYDREANTVGREYDAWTTEGILEYYWGEHIHLGYYNEGQRKGPFYGGKDFIEAKYDFIEKMLEFSKVDSPKKVLDVGCGIGGTSRYLAKKFPRAEVTGITISEQQQKRATMLAEERGIPNVKFELCDALNMTYDDNSFDFVWACESGEHMPDKKKYVEEMARVLKPGGRIVIATWCQREEPPAFNAKERKTLDYLYGEWTHPYFISIDDYAQIMQGTGKLSDIVTDDWAKQTIPAWRHSIWVGVWDIWPVLKRPHLWWKVLRDAWCLEVMHRAFTNGLMRYGMMTAAKPVDA